MKPNASKSIKSKSRARNGASTGQKDQQRRREPQGTLVTLTAGIAQKSVMRRFSLAGTVSSDASGIIALTASGCADLISALGTEWTNFSQEYAEFRPLRYGIRFFPSTTNATSSTGPYQTGVVACTWAQLKPTSVNSIYQASEMIKWSTLEEKEIGVKANFANSKLWNPVGTAMPIDRDFGLAYIGLASVAVSSRVFTILFEMDAEFRTPY